jgi:hypothetical protein
LARRTAKANCPSNSRSDIYARFNNSRRNHQLKTAEYDPNFADHFYDRSIVCWLPAPNADTKVSWPDSLMVSLIFRTVFLFDGNVLSEVRVILDNHGL